jgi:leucyl aminopeptidase
MVRRAKEFDREAARSSQTLYRSLEPQATEATLHFASLALKDKEARWVLAYLARHLTMASYRYTETVSKPKEAIKLHRLIININGAMRSQTANSALREGRAIGLGMNEARNLLTCQGNVCTPTYLAQHARKLARNQTRLGVTVLEEEKCGSWAWVLLCVSASSARSQAHRDALPGSQGQR